MDEKKIVFYSLSALLLLKVALHLPVIFYGMPYAFGNPDENDFIGAALNYGATGSIKPIITWYPAFYSYVITGGVGVLFIIQKIFTSLSGVNDFAAGYLIHPGYFHMTGRIMSLLFSMASLIIIYHCGRIYKNRYAGLFAALIFTFSTVVLRRSVWALPAGLFTLLIVISLLYLLLYFRDNKTSFVILAGLFCGLGISTKYNVGPFLLVGLSAIYLKITNEYSVFSRSRLKLFLTSKNLYYYILFIIAGFIIGSPYWLLDISSNLEGLLWEVGRLNAEKTVSEFWLSNIPYLWIFSELVIKEHLIGILLILSIVPLVSGSIKPEKKTLLFTAFFIISFILIGKYEKHSLHYLLPVFPALFVFTGGMLEDFRIRLNLKQQITAIAILIILLLLPFNNVITYSIKYFNNPDIRLEASRWINNNIQAGSVIAIGKTSNAPPLDDSNRFSKEFYSSISEQMISKKLSDNIKTTYLNKTETFNYKLVNYIVKRSGGRGKSFESMKDDIKIIPFGELSSANPDYLICSSFDRRYYVKEGLNTITDINEYKKSLREIKSFISDNNENKIVIYEFTASVDSIEAVK